jgi:membrane associated rhomboid family serine protease
MRELEPPLPEGIPGRLLPVIIVPLSGRMSLKNPPVATIALILVNCIIFFAFHFTDVRTTEKAEDYYVSSGLAQMEVKAFDQYKAYGKVVSLTAAEVRSRPYPLSELYPRLAEMHQDRKFMARLEKEQVITQGLEVYPQWKGLRGQFDAILSGTKAMGYGFRPAYWKPYTMLTYMFLHGGLFHLLGNMLFLWLAGCVVELAWGRLAMLFIYVTGGLFSAAIFGLAYLSSTGPLVGASGAIAALMGSYAILYGRRKIKVFYSLGVFFNYSLVPGIVILVLWIGNEFFQLLLDKAGGVAYMAHIGGFSGGAFLGFLCRRYFGKEGRGASSPGEGESVPALLDEAFRKVETLDVEGARAALLKVLETEPGNRAALTQMFHLDKLRPDSIEFHDSTRKLITNLTGDRLAHGEAQAVYREYLEKTPSPKLPRSMVFSLISYFASTGHLEDAEDIVGVLLKKSPDLPKIPESLLYLARACVKDGRREKARSYFQVICLRYPNSRECVVAQRILDDLES